LGERINGRLTNALFLIWYVKLQEESYGGYTNKILEVDLSIRKMDNTDVPRMIKSDLLEEVGLQPKSSSIGLISKPIPFSR